MSGCGSCVSPRNRESFIRLKSESPKFRDTMRKKCQQRWRENRWRFLDKNRSISECPERDIRDTVKNIVKDDLMLYFQSPHDLLEDIDNEDDYLEDDEFKWFFSEYDKIIEDDDKLANLFEELESDRIFCPICEKNYLSLECLENSSIVICPCGLRVPTVLQMSQIKYNINNIVENHNYTCDKKANFTVVNDGFDIHVYLCCDSCCNLSLLF